MRELIEKTVVYNYNKGLDELGLNYIIYARERGGVNPLKYIVKELLPDGPPDYWKPAFIEKLVKELTDEELLVMLDSQACQNYR